MRSIVFDKKNVKYAKSTKFLFDLILFQNLISASLYNIACGMDTYDIRNKINSIIKDAIEALIKK